MLYIIESKTPKPCTLNPKTLKPQTLINPEALKL